MAHQPPRRDSHGRILLDDLLAFRTRIENRIATLNDWRWRHKRDSGVQDLNLIYDDFSPQPFSEAGIRQTLTLNEIHDEIAMLTPELERLNKFIRQRTRQRGGKSTRKSTRKSAKKSARKSAKKFARKSAKKYARKSVRKSARKSVRKSVRKSAKKSARKSARKSVRKYVSKSARKSSRRYEAYVISGLGFRPIFARKEVVDDIVKDKKKLGYRVKTTPAKLTDRLKTRKWVYYDNFIKDRWVKI